MVVVRRQSTQEDNVKAFQEYQGAMDKVQEYLNFVGRAVQRRNATIADLDTQIAATQKKLDGLEGSIKQKEDDSLALQKKEADKIISVATARANKDAEMIVQKARDAVVALEKEKKTLEAAVANLQATRARTEKDAIETIAELEGKAKSLTEEVGKLTFVRDELRKQVNAVRERVSSILAT